MNIKQAREIPLKLLVEYFGGRFSHFNNDRTETWYYSPLRPKERTASFKINEKKNTWYDFGHSGNLKSTGAGGDILDLWCDYYQLNRKGHIQDVLAGLATLGLQPYTQDFLQPVNTNTTTPKPPRWKILKVHNKIFYPSLKEELAKRRISKTLSSLYLKQVFIQDNEKPNRKINGIAFLNCNAGGMEICIPNPIKETCFKTGIIKGPSIVEGLMTEKVSIFEGFWDFLSWMELYNFVHPPHDCYILNSNSFIEQIIRMIKGKREIKFVSSYMDNDESGYQATHTLAGALEPIGISFQDMSPNYKDHKDVNEYWMDTTIEKRPGFGNWSAPKTAFYKPL